MRALRLLVLSFGLALAAAPATAQISILGLKNSLVQFALEQLSTPDQFEISAGGVEEPEEGVTELVDVRIRDSQGVWFEAEGVAVSWSPRRILVGELAIDSLVARGVRVLRPPAETPTPAEEEEDDAEAEDDALFEWPRAPIATVIEEMRLDGVFLAPGVLTDSAVRLNATGAARDEGDEQAVRLEVTRIDEVEGRIDLDYLRDFEAGTLRLDLDAREAAGGLVAGLLGLPEDAASQVSISAEGPLSDWSVDFAAEAERVLTVEGSGAIDLGPPFALSAEAVARPGPELSPEAQAALGEAATLDIRASEGADGVIDIETARLTAPALDLTADGTFARETGALDATLSLEARAALAALVPGVDFERVAFDGTATGALDDLEAEGDLALAGVETGPVDLGSGAFAARIDYAPDRIGVALDGSASGLRLDRLRPETVGEAELALDAALAGDTLTLDALRLDSPLLALEASGALGPEAAGLDYALDAPELGPITAAYDVEAGGALSAAGRVEGPLDAPRVRGDLALDGLTYQGESWGRVALDHDATLGPEPRGTLALEAEGTPYGPARVATELALADRTLRLDGLEAGALGLRVAGDLAYGLDDGLAEGALDIESTDLAALGGAAGTALEGTLEGRVALSAEDGEQGATADLSGSDLAALGARVETLALEARLSDLYGAPRGEGTLALSDVASDEIRLAALRIEGVAEERDGRAVAEGTVSAEGLDAFGARLASLSGEARAENLAGDPSATVSLEAAELAYDPAEARVARLTLEGTASALTSAPRAEGVVTLEDAAAAGATVARIEIEGAGADLAAAPEIDATLTAETLAYPPLDAEIALASFEGQASDLLDTPEAEGRLVLDALRVAGAEAARVALDGRGRDLVDSPSVEGVLTVDALAYPAAEARVARLRLDASAEDLLGALSAEGTLTAEDIAAAGTTSAGLDAEFSGTGLATDRPEGALDARVNSLAGAGDATLTAELSDEAEGRLTAALDIGAVALDAARLGGVEAQAGATGLYGDTPEIDASLTARDGRAGEARLARLRAGAAGPLSAVRTTLAATGRLADDAPEISLDARATVDAVTEPEIVDVEIAALALAYGEEEARLRRPARLRLAPGETRLDGLDLELPGAVLTGDAALYGDGLAAEVALRVEDGPRLAGLAGAPLADGTARLDASIDTRPGQATGRLDLRADALRFAIGDEETTSTGLDLVAEGRWANGRARLDARLEGGLDQPVTAFVETPLRATGGLLPAVPPGARLDGGLQWRGRLDRLWALVPAPDHVLRGEAIIDLAFGGSLPDLDVSGDLELRDGQYQNLTLGTILTELTLSSNVAADGGFTLALDANDGAGAPVSARATLDDGDLAAEIRSQEAVLVRREDATAAITMSIDVEGALDAGLTVTGEVLIDRAEIRLVNALPPSVPTLGDVRIKGAPEEDEDADGAGFVALDLDIRAPQDVFVRGRGLDSEWMIDLEVDGFASAPVVTGRIERIRGVLNLIGFPFDLERGEIVFRGEDPIDPSIDVALTRENEGVTGGIFVEGTASDIEIAFRSRPSLPESEVLPRILFGKSEQSLTPGEALQLAAGLAVLLDGAGDFGLGALRSAVGLDVLRVELEGEQASAVAGSNLTEDVFVGVKQPLDGGSARVQVEVEIFDNLTADSEVGDDSGVSFGLNWKRDF